MGNNLRTKTRQETKTYTREKQTSKSNSLGALGLASLVGVLFAVSSSVETEEEKELRLFKELFYYDIVDGNLCFLPKNYPYPDLYLTPEKKIKNSTTSYKDNVEKITELAKAWGETTHKEALKTLQPEGFARVYVKLRKELLGK